MKTHQRHLHQQANTPHCKDSNDPGKGYNYTSTRSLKTAQNARDAIEITMQNYLCEQLGLSEQFCRERVSDEEHRLIPKKVSAELIEFGWTFKDKRILEVGSGQGGMILELLEQGVDAYGVEPGLEFATLARLRLQEGGHDSNRVSIQGGESLPYPDNYFNYAISLQVLEHVPDPLPVLQEIYRVLRPGGQCHLRCENYLSFREPHYRIAWLPLLPKMLGRIYLKIRGRNPEFFTNHIYYTTYPEVRRKCAIAGFLNITHMGLWEKWQQPSKIRTWHLRLGVYLLRCFPKDSAKVLVDGIEYLRNVLMPGVSLSLQKPF
jgi:ubiquinone/menaquinone biosynthesis C-methylase UbiE